MAQAVYLRHVSRRYRMLISGCGLTVVYTVIIAYPAPFHIQQDPLKLRIRVTMVINHLGIVTLLTCFYRIELFRIAKRHHTSLSLVDAGSPHCRIARILHQASSESERK